MVSKKSLKNLENGKKFKSDDKATIESGRKGGINSGISKRRKTDLKELLELGLSLPDDKTGELNDMAMTISLIKKAVNGDVKAFEVIRDTIGQKPKDVVENINPPTININGLNI